MKKEKEEVYTLTLKGWLSTQVGDVDKLINELKVYMYEYKKNGIVLDDGTFSFVEIEKVKERKKK
jgi:long-subunit acyl-CoA synthetase (AMP-forming)